MKNGCYQNGWRRAKWLFAVLGKVGICGSKKSTELYFRIEQYKIIS